MCGSVINNSKRLYVRVVLVGVEGPINLGAVARLVKNFDVDDLFLVSPYARPDDEEAIRFAAHAKDVLGRAIIVETLDDALRDVGLAACTSARVGQKSDVLRHPLTPWEFAKLAPRYERVAVVFGRESVGLTRDELRKCDVLVSIPASREYPVLNLSHAVGIVLYELFKETRLGLSQFRVEHVNPQLLRALASRFECIASRVVEDQRVEHVKIAIHRILFKSSLTAGEASSIAYFLKKLAKKLGANECLE